MPRLSPLQAAGAATGIAGAAIAGIGLAALRRSMPRTQGTLRLPELSAPVEVLRDQWGVPHIYAANTTDLFMAQGFIHAQERLWQMEFQRRLGHGRLSELLGKLAIDTDRHMRILGLARVAQSEVDLLDEESFVALSAYAAGVNRYMTNNRRHLPPEFTLLQIRPEPWQLVDTIVWSKVMALSLCDNWSDEIIRARLLNVLGESRITAFMPRPADQNSPIVQEGLSYTSTIGQKALDLAASAAQFVRNGYGQGSNNWVVSGERSASGKPLLANDPHLAISIPSVWFENHLHSADFHVTGVSLPGCPGVIIGHNQHIAWGITNGMNDVQDLYIERFDPNDPSRYQVEDSWQLARIVREEIRVRGQREPVIEEVRITRHGPVIDEFVQSQPHDQRQAHEALALRWTALEPGKTVNAILALNRAHDWESFRAALSDWHTPSQNFIYADDQGHIGYTLGGKIPMRNNNNGTLPVPGWNNQHEWQGYIPDAELPHTLDPQQGYVATANNRIASDDFPYALPGEYHPNYRIMRIRQLIEQTSQHTATTFATIHSDIRSLAGLGLAAFAGRLPGTTAIAQQARDSLATWDGEMNADSVAATVYTVFREQLLKEVFADANQILEARFGLGGMQVTPGNDILNRIFPELLEHLEAADDSWLGDGRSWDRVLARAWEHSLEELTRLLGNQVDSWTYKRIHSVTLRHPLGVVPVLGKLFNRGPLPANGDRETVCMGHMEEVIPGQKIYIAPSYRLICDTANWNNSTSIHAVGQSGHPLSRHYADFVQPWQNAEYHPMPWDRPYVEEATRDHLILEP